MKSREKTREVLENWSQQLEHRKTKRTEPGVRKGKRSLLACNTHVKYSMKTPCNSVKVKLGIQVMKLVKSLIGFEDTIRNSGS